MTYTCPRCHASSENPNDERERYCGRCHRFEGPLGPMPMIRSPRCPRCGNEPALIISVQQAFCGNLDCNVFCWDMRDDAATFEATAITRELSLVEPE